MEKTELDAHLETLLSRAESTKHWTEKIMKQTEVLLQPNPSKRKCLIKQDCSLALLQVTIKRHAHLYHQYRGSELRVKAGEIISLIAVNLIAREECEVPHLFLAMGLRPSPNDEYF